jgi:methylaspartate ammonia-lyase
MKIKDVVLTKGYTGFYFDDQKAIKNDAKQDGLLYMGEPLTKGFTQIRMPGESISIQLILEDGCVAVGDCAAVQYSGAGGRDPLFLADDYMPIIEKHVVPKLIGESLISFKDLAKKYDELSINGSKMHTAIRYGLSQALLSAVALAKRKTMAEVIRDEYNPSLKMLKRVPIFTQSGDDRYVNVDKMILKEADSLPHGLINNVKTKLGLEGELLLKYVGWLKDRVLLTRKHDTYLPDLHLDTYGTVGIAFQNNIDTIILYCKALEAQAYPLKLRLEGPIDTGDREGTMQALKEITRRLDLEKINIDIVADEWCNTLEDIKYFADHKAGHMLQIKTPDLGSIHNVAEAILYCKEKGILAYSGGTCNETNISAEATTSVAIACGADLCLAKPAMDVDSGYMIVNNFMERTIQLANHRK